MDHGSQCKISHLEDGYEREKSYIWTNIDDKRFFLHYSREILVTFENLRVYRDHFFNLSAKF